MWQFVWQFLTWQQTPAGFLFRAMFCGTLYLLLGSFTASFANTKGWLPDPRQQMERDLTFLFAFFMWWLFLPIMFGWHAGHFLASPRVAPKEFSPPDLLQKKQSFSEEGE